MQPLLSMLLLLTFNIAFAAPQVLVSIKPIHDLVSAVMDGVAEPTLIVPVGASPHDYALSPKQSMLITKADLVIWVGPDLEIFLIKAISNRTQQTLKLINLPSLTLYHTREGKDWGPHTGTDPHLWLSPHNAQIMVQAFADTLSKLDPCHQSIYQHNAQQSMARLTQLEQSIVAKIKPIQNKPYIVFHDAYQYFENVFHTSDKGAITTHPDTPPSAGHMAMISDILKNNHVRCIFSEPQFKTGLVEHIAEQNDIKSGILDPIGDTSTTGIAAYELLLNHMADNLVGCLK